MLRSLWTAASGMAAQKLNMDVIANNLANVNTGGFKKSRADFEDLLYQSLRSPGYECRGTDPHRDPDWNGDEASLSAENLLPGRLCANKKPAGYRH